MSNRIANVVMIGMVCLTVIVGMSIHSYTAMHKRSGLQACVDYIQHKD